LRSFKSNIAYTTKRVFLRGYIFDKWHLCFHTLEKHQALLMSTNTSTKELITHLLTNSICWF